MDLVLCSNIVNIRFNSVLKPPELITCCCCFVTNSFIECIDPVFHYYLKDMHSKTFLPLYMIKDEMLVTAVIFFSLCILSTTGLFSSKVLPDAIIRWRFFYF